MREERANFRFLVIAAVLLLIAVAVSVLALTSLVHANNKQTATASTSLVSISQVHDLPQDEQATAKNNSTNADE